MAETPVGSLLPSTVKYEKLLTTVIQSGDTIPTTITASYVGCGQVENLSGYLVECSSNHELKVSRAAKPITLQNNILTLQSNIYFGPPGIYTVCLMFRQKAITDIKVEVIPKVRVFSSPYIMGDYLDISMLVPRAKSFKFVQEKTTFEDVGHQAHFALPINLPIGLPADYVLRTYRLSTKSGRSHEVSIEDLSGHRLMGKFHFGSYARIRNNVVIGRDPGEILVMTEIPAQQPIAPDL